MYDDEDESDRPPRREDLAEYIGDTLALVEGGDGIPLSTASELQRLNVHPPTPLGVSGYDEQGDWHEVIDVSEFDDWRPLLGRQVEGIDIIIADFAPEKFGEGVLERGLQFRLEGGLSFIAAVDSECGALWLPGEMPEIWRREIYSITPVA